MLGSQHPHGGPMRTFLALLALLLVACAAPADDDVRARMTTVIYVAGMT